MPSIVVAASSSAPGAGLSSFCSSTSSGLSGPEASTR